MSLFNFSMINRRVFLRASALWATAAALHVPVVTPASAQRPKEGEYDAIVIGAGLGGLTFAGYMAKQGFKVLVLEHHDVPGGYATTFTRDRGRFTFDVSLHQTALGGAGKAILTDLGVLDKVRFYRASELFRVLGTGVDVTCPGGDPKAFEQVLLEKFPQEKKGIQGFMADATGVSEETEKLFEEGELTTLKKALFPLRFPRLWAARKKTLADYLNEYTTNPSLKSVMSVLCGYYGLPPSKLSGFLYMTATGGYFRYGGSYPAGGSQAISNAITELIESKGGQVRLGTRVAQVLTKDGRAMGVKTSGGESLTAKAVAANCSIVSLFSDMLPGAPVPSDYLQRLRALKPSVSSFQVWLGLNKDITDTVKDSHVFLQAEQDPEKAHQYCLEARADKSNIGVCIYNNIAKELSPPGTTTLSITFITGYEPWKRFEQDYFAGKKTEYNARKKEITETLIRRVEEQLIPGLRTMIAVQESATPLTNVRYTLNTAGAIYGLEQSMDNSFMTRILNRTPIKGLYLSSAWGDPGGGYTGVLIGGKRAFGMLMEDWA
ncbi:MAG: NAD(P)/FAD-dependent oxidoreductase [Desulfomonile tiedjei]|nr:NAD(P)/FAD-dependent oxidoreductase [Desulfomonile tiedjei]